jgi:hypothetical protein
MTDRPNQYIKNGCNSKNSITHIPYYEEVLKQHYILFKYFVEYTDSLGRKGTPCHLWPFAILFTESILWCLFFKNNSSD